MLTADLTVTDNGTATKPGALGAKVYALVISPNQNEKSLRRIAATATTTPQELVIQHQLIGKGVTQRTRTLVSAMYSVLDYDPTLTGGKVPFGRFYGVLDTPTNTAGGLIIDSVAQNLIGTVVDVLTASGQLAKLRNLEA